MLLILQSVRRRLRPVALEQALEQCKEAAQILQRLISAVGKKG